MTKDVASLVVELAEYQGGDKVITSHEMKSILSELPKVVPVMSRLPQLDRYTGGFAPGELIAISGPRKAGKTLFAQTLTSSFAKQEVMSLWFSFELHSREFINRFPVNYRSLPCRQNSKRIAWNGLESALLRGWSSMV